jgi:hypothetical protein
MSDSVFKSARLKRSAAYLFPTLGDRRAYPARRDRGNLSNAVFDSAITRLPASISSEVRLASAKLFPEPFVGPTRKVTEEGLVERLDRS